MKREELRKLRQWQDRLETAKEAIQPELDRMGKRESIYDGDPTIYRPDGAKAEAGRASHVRNVAFELVEAQVESDIPTPKVTAIRQEEENRTSEELDIPAIRQALDEALSFTGNIDTALVATILDKVVVKKESTKDAIHLDIFLKLGSTYEAVYTPLKHTAGITSLKNTTHKPPTRRI